MSSAEETAEESDVVVCNNCGVAEVDEIKLKSKDCDGGDLVKYCSDKCMEEHREQHEEECKKRGQELHDNKLFKQPERSHRGECPLCFLPMPLRSKNSSFYSCCSIVVCNGCEHAHYKSNGGQSCPFCREPRADKKESDKRVMNRVKANDPAAMSVMGLKLYYEGDCDTAFRYLTKAAQFGDIEAHYNLGVMYRDGEGVEKDEEKKVYHYEKAAIGGHPYARHNLGCAEHKNGNFDRSVKHYIIAANLGFEDSMKELWKHYSAGNITKEDLESTLRAHKAAIDAMKSRQREAAEKFWIWKDSR